MSADRTHDPMTSGAEAVAPTPDATPKPPAGNPLRNGNRGGNPWAAPRCGARNRRGLACRGAAMRNAKTGKRTRCFHHGGASTGPRTGAGIERIRAANTKHGGRSGGMRSLLRRPRETRLEAAVALAEHLALLAGRADGGNR